MSVLISPRHSIRSLLLNAKVLSLDLLVRAVSQYGIYRLIEELDQIFVALPDGDARTFPEIGGIIVVSTHKFPVLAVVGLQKAPVQRNRIREQQVQAPGYRIPIRLLLGGLSLDLHKITQLGSDKVVVDSTALHANRLSL